METYDFLSHHDTIKSLQIMPDPGDRANYDLWTLGIKLKPPVPMTLPHLEFFCGPAASVPHLISRSIPSRLFLLWTPGDEEVIIPIIPRSVKTVENMVVRWNSVQKVIINLAKHLPDLENLRFTGMEASVVELDQSVGHSGGHDAALVSALISYSIICGK